MTTTLRGLNTFITDIRHCPNKEQEQKRVEDELAKIRNKFTRYSIPFDIKAKKVSLVIRKRNMFGNYYISIF
jgi:hypothetical protein